MSSTDRVACLGGLQLGTLLKLRDGRYHRVVPRQTVLAERDGVTLMVPRLPELPPDTAVVVCGDGRRKKGTLVTRWTDGKKQELLVALNEDPSSIES